jgi:hypothetical protein
MKRAERRVSVSRTLALLISVISLVFFIGFKFYLQFISAPRPRLVDPVNDFGPYYAPPGHVDPIITNTSIAFYVIAGASQKALTPDLRGKFWEFQLESFTGQASVTYLSDGPLSVNGIDFLVLPNGSRSYSDQQFCIRTPETWRHFMRENSLFRWYFRGTHDTFVNLTALTLLIHDLESKIDPMTNFSFAFNFHEYGNSYYPHGGTGWLFSNYAVRKMHESVYRFITMCYASFDDVALARFLGELGLNIMDYQTNKFIVTFPCFDLDVVLEKKWEKVGRCPKTYHLYPGSVGLLPAPPRVAASIHMHRVPMDQAWKILSATPESFAVYFPDPNTPKFCQIRE